MLQFNQLKKQYGDHLVLDIPEFRLEPGLFWLQGPNGAGKTTLLRIVAGILRFKGDIRLCGFSLRKEAVRYRQLISWADAEPLYPGFLTGSDLLAFYRNIMRPDTGDVDQLCSALGVGPWLGTRSDGWSSGMTKKISLFLALLGRPALVALDEPFITLDEPGSNALVELITAYQRDFGTSFLLSSHQDPPVAGIQGMYLADRSVRLI